MMLKKSLLALSLGALLSACASAPESSAIDTTREVTGNPLDNAPSWVFLPKSDKGLAASSCVEWTGNMSIDRPHSIANARADLAQQINIKASVLDKLYNRKLQTEGKSDVGSTFEQVSKQIASESLANSTPEEISLATLDGKKYLCTLVVLSQSENTFDDLVEGSGRQLDPQSKAALYEEFRAQKAMKDLEKELESL
ncbi:MULTISPECIES: hypothetical protein [unclassified Marinobacter]|uniref:hypothetical protein n=1 Tax=unclassified Marinobacter TaxID=83889 RepID=UPI000BFA1011|nr:MULTISPECIES: hypothetical protein [unclassified Marinobacter]PFG10349.1 hypothetical protein ATI45_2789 [Marinobacter sp. LV10MA510-1]PFG52253.1 hypothetical protein ATG98_1261 [Marinobacter sp. LV10R520-4]